MEERLPSKQIVGSSNLSGSTYNKGVRKFKIGQFASSAWS